MATLASVGSISSYNTVNTVSDDEDDHKSVQVLDYDNNSSSDSEYSEKEFKTKTTRATRTLSSASSSSGVSTFTSVSINASLDTELTNDNDVKEGFFIRKRNLTISQGRLEVDQKTKSFLQTIIMNFSTQKEDALCLLYTYRKLAEPRQLWYIWLEVIALYSGDHSDPTASDILNNCCDFMFMWVDYFGKFDFSRRRYQLEMLEIAAQYNLPRPNEFKLAFIRLNTRRLRKIYSYNKYLKRLQQLMKQQQVNNQLRMSTGSLSPPESPMTSPRNYEDGSAAEGSDAESPVVRRSPSSLDLRSSTSSVASSVSENAGATTKTPVKAAMKSISFQNGPPQSLNFISGVFSPYLTNISPLAPSSTTSPRRGQEPTVIPKFLNMLEMHTQLLANALTMHDYGLFLSIHPLEFIAKIGWVNKARKGSRRIDRLIFRFNEVSRWVATEILTRNEQSVQITLLEKFIEIAKKCEELNNFNTLLALLSGLNNFAVHRLKDVWNGISEKSRKDFEYLEELMNPSYNYKNYATQLTERKTPILPYCGLYLRDFTFMAENEIKKNGEPDIDVIRMVGNRLNHVRQWQIVPYKLDTTSHVMEYITRLYTIEDEDSLYQLSLKAAPAIWENSAKRFSSGRDSGMSDSEEERVSTPQAQPLEPSVTPKRRSMLELDSIDDPEDPENTFIGERSHIPKEMAVSTDKAANRKSGSRMKSKRSIARCSTVIVPDRFTKDFMKSERIVDKWFAGSQVSPLTGTLVIFEERFLLLRGSSLSFDFFKVAKKAFDLDNSKHSRIFSRNILYDVGHGMGSNDAKMFRLKNEEKNLSAFSLLAAGPSNMSYKGWAFVKVLEDTNFAEDPKDFIMYAEFAYSFEASSWPSDQKSEISMCSMSSGYLCGWCSESFEFPMVCVEVSCRAKGDPTCLLLVCHPDVVQQKLNTFTENLSKEDKAHLFVPTALTSTKYDLNHEKGKVTTVFRTLKKSTTSKKSTSLVAQQLTQYNSTTNMHKQLTDLAKLAMPQHATSLFGDLKCNADKAHVCFTERNNDPYIFVRSKTLSVEFFNTTKELFGEDQKDVAIDFCVTFLYNVGRSLGQSDFQHLTSKLKPETNVLEKFLLLEHALSYSGWGKLEILPKTQISAKGKDVAVMVQFQLHASCEASSWINNYAQLKVSHCNARSPVCIIAAGYCAGWSSACFQTRLGTVEVSCKANGASCCSFIMTHVELLDDCVGGWWKENGRQAEDMNSLLVLQHLKKKQEGQTVFTLLKKTS